LNPDSKTITAWLRNLKHYKSWKALNELRLYVLPKFIAFKNKLTDEEKGKLTKANDVLGEQFDLFRQLIKDLPLAQQEAVQKYYFVKYDNDYDPDALKKGQKHIRSKLRRMMKEEAIEARYPKDGWVVLKMRAGDSR